MYYILHVPSGTYLYRFIAARRGLLAITLVASFETKEDAQKILEESLQDWRSGDLYHEDELRGIGCSGTYVLAEFEIVYRDI